MIEQLILRLPLAHTGWSVDNIVKNLAMPAEGEPGRTAHIIMLVVWLSFLGAMLLGLCWHMVQDIRGKWNPPSMFSPPWDRSKTWHRQ